jgi:S-methylmethionine-dependent homocysteine/selenocysteine methylase
MIIRNDLGNEKYLDGAKDWIRSGATIVGGCCGIRPSHISYLAKNI